MTRHQTVFAAISVMIAALVPSARAAQDQVDFLPPPSVGYEVRGLMTLPGLPGTAFAPLRDAGLYKTVDGGANWTPANVGLDGTSILRTINRRPGSTTEFYLAVQGDAGFYKSTDSGATWVPSNSGLQCHYVRGITVFSAPDEIYAHTSCDSNSGIYKSTDYGATWTRYGYPSLPDDFRPWTVARSGANIWVTGDTGVYFSSDSGATFAQRNGTFPNNLTGPMGPVIFATLNMFTSPKVVHVNGGSVYSSTDNGLNWFPVSGIPASAASNTGFSGSVPTSTGSFNYYAIDGVGLFKSTNPSSSTWTLETGLAGLPHKMTRFISADANTAGTLWAGTYAGVYKSTDAGVTWAKTSNGMPGFNLNSAVHPTTPATLLAQNETVYRSLDSGQTWAAADAGIGGITAFNATIIADATNPGTVYSATNNKGIFKSTNFGTNWVPINSGLPDQSAKSPTFRIAPSNTSTLYLVNNCVNPEVANGGVYKSTNAGASWTNVGIFKGTAGGLSWPNPAAGAAIPASERGGCPTNLAIHPTDPNTVYVTVRGGAYRSTNGGANFDAAVGAIFKTTNGGTSWTDISPGGIGFRAGRPEILFSDPQQVAFVSTHTDNFDRATSVAGVYYSRDGGDTWRQWVPGELVSQVRLVRTTPSSSVTMYVNTFGSYDQPPEAGHRLFKCVDVSSNQGDFDPQNHCSAVDLPSGTRSVYTISTNGVRVTRVGTSHGLGVHRFNFKGPDFNHDSRSDILWNHSIAGASTIWHMRSLSFYGESGNNGEDGGVVPTRTIPSPWTIAATGDFNGDGSSDILLFNPDGGLYVYLMDKGNVLAEGYVRQLPAGWAVAGVGDLDGDGKSDIVVQNTGTGQIYVLFMNGLVASSEGSLTRVVPSGWTIAAVADFNGDRKADILLYNAGTGQIYLFPMSGLTILGSEGSLTRLVSAPWSLVGVGDFNQDNKADLLWRNGSTGQNYVFPMDGTTILGTEGSLPTVADLAWKVALVADFDGSESYSLTGSIRGRSDILWRNDSTGLVYQWRMQGPTLVSSVCGSMGCNSGFLPQVPDLNWLIINK